jgi:hypothetical protein
VRWTQNWKGKEKKYRDDESYREQKRGQEMEIAQKRTVLRNRRK